MANAAELVEKLHNLCIFSSFDLLGKKLNRIYATLNGIAILDEVVEVVER